VDGEPARLNSIVYDEGVVVYSNEVAMLKNGQMRSKHRVSSSPYSHTNLQTRQQEMDHNITKNRVVDYSDSSEIQKSRKVAG